jgi:hypothetical protein
MLGINTHTIKDHLKNNLIKLSMVYPMTRKSHFVLIESLSITLTNSDVIEIPKGFRFDGSSAPRFIWWAFPSYGDFFFAAMLHDYMYQNQHNHSVLGHKKAQEMADKEMLKWSNVINNRNFGKKIDNYLRYLAVRLFGKKVYLEK